MNERSQGKAKRDASRAGAASDLTRRRPTINDIARLAEVSKKTVSRVINESPFREAEDNPPEGHRDHARAGL